MAFTGKQSILTQVKPFEYLCSRIVDEISSFVNTNTAPRYTVVIYVRSDFFNILESCETFRWHQHPGYRNYVINGWPLYVIDNGAHPEYLIHVKAET